MTIPVNDTTSMTDKSQLLWSQDKVSVHQPQNRSDLSSKSDYQNILDLILKNPPRGSHQSVSQQITLFTPSIIESESLNTPHNKLKTIKETKRQTQILSQKNDNVKRDMKEEATRKNRNEPPSLESANPDLNYPLKEQDTEQGTSVPQYLQEIKSVDDHPLEDEINEDLGAAHLPEVVINKDLAVAQIHIEAPKQNVDVIQRSNMGEVKEVADTGPKLPKAPENLKNLEAEEHNSQPQADKKSFSPVDVIKEKPAASDTSVQASKPPETTLAKNFIETLTKASKIPFEEVKQNLNDAPLSLTPVKPVQAKNDLLILTKNAAPAPKGEGGSSTSHQNNSNTSQSHTQENTVSLPKNTHPSSSSAMKTDGQKSLFSHKVTKEISDQVNVVVNRELKNNNRRISIQLKPASLGRVDIQLILSADGMAVAKVKASNQDTLNVLRRDEKGISDILRENGFELENSGMEFELTKDNSNSDAYFAQTSGDQGRASKDMINDQDHDAETAGEDIIQSDDASEMDPYSDHLLNVIV